MGRQWSQCVIVALMSHDNPTCTRRKRRHDRERRRQDECEAPLEGLQRWPGASRAAGSCGRRSQSASQPGRSQTMPSSGGLRETFRHLCRGRHCAGRNSNHATGGLAVIRGQGARFHRSTGGLNTGTNEAASQCRPASSRSAARRRMTSTAAFGHVSGRGLDSRAQLT